LAAQLGLGYSSPIPFILEGIKIMKNRS